MVLHGSRGFLLTRNNFILYCKNLTPSENIGSISVAAGEEYSRSNAGSIGWATLKTKPESAVILRPGQTCRRRFSSLMTKENGHDIVSICCTWISPKVGTFDSPDRCVAPLSLASH